MNDFNRRDALKVGAGAAAAAATAGEALAQQQTAPAAVGAYPVRPEPNAQIRLLRWSRFVEGEERQYLANVRKFTERTRVQVRVDNASFEDIRPKAAVAANVGRGPDIILGWYDDAHQYPDRLVDLTDLATWVGRRNGGWYPIAERYGKKDNRWIGLPLGAPGGTMNHRISWMREAGFEQFPRDLPGFLRLCQGLKRIGHPPGFALGQAVGDANGWTHWLMWAHGGKMVNDAGDVVINSPEVIAALEYAKQLYETFIPGTLSWNDTNNNRAFLSGEISLTANGISIYYAAKNSQNPAERAIADDMNHANYPVGPVNRTTELHSFTQYMVFKYTRFPNAVKAFLAFMMDPEQMNPWIQESIGYVTPANPGFESHPIWTSDPKATPYRDVVKNMLWSGYSGPLGYASAAAMADYIVVNMFAEAASGARTPQQAAERAAERANRYYRI
jgi:multiple sugar transport system substrate-binding protein